MPCYWAFISFGAVWYANRLHQWYIEKKWLILMAHVENRHINHSHLWITTWFWFFKNICGQGSRKSVWNPQVYTFYIAIYCVKSKTFYFWTLYQTFLLWTTWILIKIWLIIYDSPSINVMYSILHYKQYETYRSTWTQRTHPTVGVTLNQMMSDYISGHELS